MQRRRRHPQLPARPRQRARGRRRRPIPSPPAPSSPPASLGSGRIGFVAERVVPLARKSGPIVRKANRIARHSTVETGSCATSSRTTPTAVSATAGRFPRRGSSSNSTPTKRVTRRPRKQPHPISGRKQRLELDALLYRKVLRANRSFQPRRISGAGAAADSRSLNRAITTREESQLRRQLVEVIHRHRARRRSDQSLLPPCWRRMRFHRP